MSDPFKVVVYHGYTGGSDKVDEWLQIEGTIVFKAEVTRGEVDAYCANLNEAFAAAMAKSQ